MIPRLRLADDETMAIEWLTRRDTLVPRPAPQELADHSYYELLRERAGITIASGVQTIEPTVTSQEEAELLGVPVHSPAFLFERTTEERWRGGGGVRPVRLPRGPVPVGDGTAPGRWVGPETPAAGGGRRDTRASPVRAGRRVQSSLPRRRMERRIG